MNIADTVVFERLMHGGLFCHRGDALHRITRQAQISGEPGRQIHTELTAGYDKRGIERSYLCENLLIIRVLRDDQHLSLHASVDRLADRFKARNIIGGTDIGPLDQNRFIASGSGVIHVIDTCGNVFTNDDCFFQETYPFL